MKSIITILTSVLLVSFSSFSQEFQKDVIQTNAGDLEITFIGHGTLMFKYQDKIIHVDPWTRLADYSKMPKAPANLQTNDH